MKNRNKINFIKKLIKENLRQSLITRNKNFESLVVKKDLTNQKLKENLRIRNKMFLYNS